MRNEGTVIARSGLSAASDDTPRIFPSRITARVTGGSARLRVDRFMVRLPVPTPLD